jgi:glutathione S-transferase
MPRDKQMPEVYGALDRILGETPYLTGQDFTVADLAVASTLIWVPMMVKEVSHGGGQT